MCIYSIICIYVIVWVVVIQSLSCVWLLWSPVSPSPPGSSVRGINQARILKWVAISFFRASSWPKNQTHISCTAGRFFTAKPPGKPHYSMPHAMHTALYVYVYVSYECMLAQLLESCVTPCDPMDCSPPGSSIHRILQARILEWVAISFSRGSSWPRDWTWVSHIAGRCFNLWATREAHIII